MKKISFTKGFSLIELMVVIAIIALLTALITSNFAQSKAKSRDGKRISDLAQIQLSLELFFDRCNGYPTSLDIAQTLPSCPNDQNGTQINLGYFISKIPTDISTNASYDYAVTNGVDYILGTQLEKDNATLQDSATGTLLGHTCGQDKYYCVKPK